MIFDINIASGTWPFRPSRFKSFAEELDCLAALGISGGVVRSLEAPLAGNLDEVNARLEETCAPHSGFVPACALRPDYGTWRSWRGRAAALYPVFHGFALTDERTLEMGRYLAAQGTVMLIVIREEDERGQHPLCKIPPVPIDDINRFARALPGARIAVVNGYLSEVSNISEEHIYADFSSVETLNSLQRLLSTAGTPSQRKFPPSRLLFGSGTPLFYPSAALAKLRDARLADETVKMIESLNAERLFHGKTSC